MAIPLLEQINLNGSQVLADRGYDSNRLIDIIVVLPAEAGEKHFQPEQKVKLINPRIVNVNINFAKNVSISFTSFGCFAHLPLSLISCLLFDMIFL